MKGQSSLFDEPKYTTIPNSMYSFEDESYLSNLLSERNKEVQNQNSQIIQLKSAVQKDLEIIKKLDETLPIEERKNTDLTKQNNILENRLSQLKAEMNNSMNEENNRSDLLTEKYLNNFIFQQNEMKNFVDQSAKKQAELNGHINTLQNYCTLLNNNIETLKQDNDSHIKTKNQIENIKNELEAENEKIAQIKKKQEQMANYLSKTEFQIQEFQNKNLKTELELYDELKVKNSNKIKKREMNFDVDVDPYDLMQNLNKAQKTLEEKETILQNEKEIYYSNEKKVKKLKKKLYDQKKLIHRYKRHLQLFESQIQQEQYFMAFIRQQHEQLIINTNQFSAQIENSIKNIEKIKKEKMMMKKELERAKSYADELKSQISSVNTFDNYRKRDQPLSPALYERASNYPVFHNFDDYEDDADKTVEIMRKQTENLQKNQRQFDNLRFDQQFLDKRIKNCHTGVLNRQTKRESLFPTTTKNSY